MIFLHHPRPTAKGGELATGYCLATNDTEACAYASAPGYTRLKAMCKETLDGVVFVQVCPIGMTEGRDLGTDQDFAARKRP